MCDDEGLFTGSPFSFGQNMKQAICRKKVCNRPRGSTMVPSSNLIASPTTVFVVRKESIPLNKDGVSKLVNVKNQDGMTKLLDMVPDFVEKFTKKEKEEPENTQE